MRGWKFTAFLKKSIQCCDDWVTLNISDDNHIYNYRYIMLFAGISTNRKLRSRCRNRPILITAKYPRNNWNQRQNGSRIILIRYTSGMATWNIRRKSGPRDENYEASLFRLRYFVRIYIQKKILALKEIVCLSALFAQRPPRSALLSPGSYYGWMFCIEYNAGIN